MAPTLRTRLKTAHALGVTNLVRVLSYRLRLRAGVHPVQRIAPVALPGGRFFAAALATTTPPAPMAWRDAANYFGWLRPGTGEAPPEWLRSVTTGRTAATADAPWWALPDFDSNLGDIKAVWEPSRFDWVVNLAQQARAGVPGSAARLNQWLADWCAKNPMFVGPNWKCAQEASIRVMHLSVAALICGETQRPSEPLVALVVGHLRRIAPTVSYAVAQDNNHGTSEAAALYIGGHWLKCLGHEEGHDWHRRGRTLLENRILRLVAADGSFSQHSTNYHRLMLETVSLVETWRRAAGLPALSDPCYGRLAAAAAWLRTLVDPATGDAPNVGANDGANLLPLTDADYRDFRPAVYLASTLFEHHAAYSDGPWQAQLEWLGVAAAPRATDSAAPASRTFDDGGLAVLVIPGAQAILRYPRFRFRPSHADALHVDLRVNGANLLRDGGSFSYADPAAVDYFGGPEGHNSVQFDDHEQMPKLSRFLWGDWLTTRTVTPVHGSAGQAMAAASYQDRFGAIHDRALTLAEGSLTVTDRLSGFHRRAVLRWRLRPGPWQLDGAVASADGHRVTLSAGVPLVRIELRTGWESRYYLQQTVVPILEVEIAAPGVVTTRYQWSG